MSEELKKILGMVADGKLKPEEAERLIGALKDNPKKIRFLKIRIYEKHGEKCKTRIDIPMTALKLFLKLGAALQTFAPEGFKINIKGQEILLDEFTPELFDKILAEIDEEGCFTLVEFNNDEKDEKVEVYIE
ncbi:MAG: hypothetical protein ABIL39_00015 [candidate division WOR-3 bacterium]